jgi:pimeloyl-ACP methyl ester carboxylesterase
MQIIAGSLDNLKPLMDHLHELVPGSRYAVIEGAAHSAHYERFEEYCRIVEAFLRDLG